MSSLDVSALTDFMAALFREYAARQNFNVQPQAAAKISPTEPLVQHPSRFAPLPAQPL